MEHPNLRKAPARLVAAGLLVVLSITPTLSAQIPSVPGLTLPGTPAKKPDKVETPLKTGDTAKPAVASTTEKITVKEAVSDRAVRNTLQNLLERFPGVRKVEVTVDNGVVTLDGQVDDDSTHDEITGFALRVEGVRLVLNRLLTDDEVMTAPELAWRELTVIGGFFRQKWLLILIAFGVLALTSLVARIMAGNSETLLAPFVGNVLLRSVVGSVLSGLIAIGGLLMALSVLKLTHVVLSIVGFAGVVGLAVGFAFKDITENFIASVLLGVRRPFRMGDFLKVAGHAGVVQSLNTRATVLVTSEGNHVRIPNSIIFKEILVNTTALPSTRQTFDLVVPYEGSTSAAQDAINQALLSQDGILHDPSPRALVDNLEPGGVRIKAYFWVPTRGVDTDKLVSDLKLKVKVELQKAGLTPPQLASAAKPSPTALPAPDSSKSAPPTAQSAQVHATIRRDSQAAADAAPVTGQEKPDIEHVLHEGDSCVADEGVNLLKNHPNERETHAEANGVHS